MSGGRPADFEARLASQTEFGRPFALEAGAGTGKTAALVARIVAWCVGPGWEEAARDGGDGEAVPARVLDGVVAITFSEAAAAEMAARTAEALAALRTADPFPVDPGAPVVTGLYRAALPAEEEAVRRRAGLLLTELERLRTGTIHAFARSILARFPVEAGIRPGFEVDADGEAIRELVDEAVAALLLPRYRSGEAVVMELAAGGFGPAEMAEAAAALERAGVPPSELEANPFTGEALERLLDELARHIVPCREDAAAYAEKPKRIGAGGRLLVELADRLQDDAGTPSGRAESIAALVADPARAAAMGKLDEWAKGNPNKPVPSVLAPETFVEHVAAALPYLRMLRSFDVAGWRLLAGALAPILEEIDRFKRRRGILGFGDLLRLARRVLEEDAGVRRRVRSEIRQLLVDEMQDTDPEQARIVELLALQGDPGRGPSLFLVGDPKQSIYAFRGADFGAYQRLVKGIRTRSGIARRLEVNFRSVPAILQEVERIVAPSMKEEPGVQAPFQPLSACPEKAALPGYIEGGSHPVEHWLAVAVDRETGNPDGKATVEETARIEARAVVEDILDLHGAHGVPLSEMAVLMRVSTHLEAFLEALREAGVPYEVGKDRTFYRTREVAETMALIRTVLDPDDALALMAVLRSPYAGVPDAALRPLWDAGLPRLAAAVDTPELGRETEESVHAAAGRTGVNVEPLEGWPDALLAFLRRLGSLRRSFAADPPDRFLEMVRRLTLAEALAAARFPGRYRLANVERFLDRLGPELARAPGAEAVLRWLRRVGRERPEEASARPRQDTGGVQVMTVHGAKGLGFGYVWIVQTAGGGRRPADGARATAARRHPETGAVELRLAGLPTPGWAAAEEVARTIQEAEELRLLYVALTRAKVRLVTVGAPAYRKTRSTGRSPGWTAPGGTFLAMMEEREGGWFLDPEELAERMELDGTLRHDGALWRLPVPPTSPGGAGRAPVLRRDAAVLLADREQLEALRAGAAARQARPWIAGVSREAHRELAEAVAAAVEGAESEDEETAPRPAAAPRDVATAVGTAVHRLLERFDVAAGDPGAELELRLGEAAAWLEGALSQRLLAEARDRLRELVETLRGGPLWERWLALGGSVLARELPVLLPPSDGPEAPVGALTGFVDLLYRDPETGELVVADYKTDDRTYIDDRTEAYRSQLALYARAVREALDLPTPPRTELWFLAAGEIVKVG